MVYMPDVLDADAAYQGSPQKVKVELIKLFLPSRLDVEDWNSICLGGVINSKKELWFAQLKDSLSNLCRARRICHGLLTFHEV